MNVANESFLLQEDYEIFDLVSAIEAAEGKWSALRSLGKVFILCTGKGTSFYSWLEVSPTASTSDIARAYRKKSVRLQCVFTCFCIHRVLRR